MFTGAGGLDTGFHKAEFNITECVEIDKRFSYSFSIMNSLIDFFINYLNYLLFVILLNILSDNRLLRYLSNNILIIVSFVSPFYPLFH